MDFSARVAQAIEGRRKRGRIYFSAAPAAKK
jgi:hypothetical protein